MTSTAEQQLIDNVKADRAGREKSTEVLAYEYKTSRSTAVRTLHKHGLSSVKPTRKPGLSNAQRAARLDFCLKHQEWSLEEWKRVIWSDETSVILGQRRGNIRLWREPHEAYERTCIRRRWKNCSEFMFWGCFSWDKKGPYHIWKKETAQERKQADEELLQLNIALEPQFKTEWELNNGMRRMNLRRRPAGKKPIWRFTKKTGKLTRESKAGGIDWYRYWKLILLPKLIPFAKECQQDRPDTLIQEDNAGPHAHRHQGTVYALYDVTRLLWPGNSPDLNAIEPAWYWLKRRTTARGAPANRKDMEQAWRQAWQDLPQETIQQWITAIPDHIKEIIKLEGGNEYKEGVKSFKRSWVGNRIKGKLSTLQSIDNKTQHQATDVEIGVDNGSIDSGSEGES
jgi:Transposase